MRKLRKKNKLKLKLKLLQRKDISGNRVIDQETQLSLLRQNMSTDTSIMKKVKIMLRHQVSNSIISRDSRMKLQTIQVLIR